MPTLRGSPWAARSGPRGLFCGRVRSCRGPQAYGNAAPAGHYGVMERKSLVLAVVGVALLGGVVRAQDQEQEATGFWDAVTGGDGWVRLRYFFENVDQDPFSKQAHGSTLRTAVGYRTAPWKGWSAMVELEDISVVGRTLYNDTIGGPTNRPVVADPEGTDWSRAWAQWSDEGVGTFRAGRQWIKLDNDRFIGNVGWRQREQSFDAVTARGEWSGLECFYGYVQRVNRVLGPESAAGEEGIDAHLANVSHEFDAGRLSVYAYHLDFEKSLARSTLSVGARFKGATPLNEDVDLLYTGEFARQTDVGDNPTDTRADYALAELGADFGGVTLRGGLEVLSGERTPGEAFQTPLATLHAFNGWADKFLNTPDAGLRDLYFGVGGKLGKIKLQAVLHDFQADVGGTDYGRELDLSGVRPINEHVTVGVKFAQYDTDGNAAFGGDADTRRAWLWISASI